MTHKEWLLFSCSSFGFVLIFPPFPLGLAAFFLLIPYFILIQDKSPGTGFRIGYGFGLIWICGTGYWIGWPTIAGLIAAILVFPLIPALFTYIQLFLLKFHRSKAWIMAPFLWTFIEILLEFSQTGLHWFSLSYTQTYTPLFIQFIEFSGPYSVTFWIVSCNVLLFLIIRRIQMYQSVQRLAILYFIFLVMPILYGVMRVHTIKQYPDKLTISAVQGNIDPYKKWSPGFLDSNYQTYNRLTHASMLNHPSLIIWPESAVPNYIRHRPNTLRRIRTILDSIQIPILTGASDYDWVPGQDPEKYNAAFLIKPGSFSMDRYIKRRLVPFSERVPWVEHIPFLYQISQKVSADVGDYTPGDSCVIFQFIPKSFQKPVSFGVLICFESVFSFFTRDFVNQGARFLTIITNDGWFGNTSGPYQHLQYAVLRAIENRVWIVRCANTGISAFIDPSGRMIEKTKFETRTSIHSEIGLLAQKTLYTQFPYLFPCLLGGIMIILIGWNYFKRRKIRNVNAIL